METKITQLRNLMTPLSNYFELMKGLQEGRCYPKENVEHIMEFEANRAIDNMPIIREILRDIPDNACETR